jgi:hypothetical protein
MRQHRFPLPAGNRHFHLQNRLEDDLPMPLFTTTGEAESADSFSA